MVTPERKQPPLSAAERELRQHQRGVEQRLAEARPKMFEETAQGVLGRGPGELSDEQIAAAKKAGQAREEAGL